MFKNSKMLKGMFLALAFVLVLGAGVLLNLNANAEGNTVVYYVSDSGNNTTGKDAATAFHTFTAVTEEANKLNLAPGTELKIVVVDQVFIKTTKLDETTVRDSAGGKVHITITSADPAKKSTILHYAYSSSGATANEKIHLANDITFKDIIISGQVQSYYQGNAPVNANGLEYGKFFRTRGIHIGSNTVEFDNCELTSTFPQEAAAKTWTLFCDGYATSKVEGGSHLRLLNGDYSNCGVYTQDQITPLWDLSCYVENASVGTVYALADTDTATSTNAKSVTCHFKDATVASYNPQGRGHIGVTNGVTAIFEGDTVIKNWVGCMSSTSSLACLNGDLTYVFRDNVSVTVTSKDVQSEYKYMYLTPHGTMNGDLHVIVEGGTFNSRMVTGSDTNKKDTQTAVINGNITNDFKGGTFKSGITCGMGDAGGTINGTITNNFYDGFKLTSAGSSYLGSRGGNCKGIVNNMYGGSFGRETYFGGGNSLAKVDKNIVDGDLVNNFYGGTYSSTVWAGPHSQTITGSLYNYFKGGKFTSTFVAGGIGINVSEMHNIFTDGENGTYATLSGTSVLGSRGKNSSGPTVQNIDRIYNTFEGKVTVSNTLYCAGGTQSGGKEIKELVQNEFKGGTFKAAVYCGTRYNNEKISADIVNTFYDGVTFTKRLYCGGAAGACNTITNNFHGGLFQGYVYGSTEFSSGNKFEVNAITNNFFGGTFESQVIGSGAVVSDGLLTNNFYGGTFKYFVYAVSNSRAAAYDAVLDENSAQVYVDKNGTQVFLNGPVIYTDSKSNLYYYVKETVDGKEKDVVHYVYLHEDGYLTYDDGETAVYLDAEGNPVKIEKDSKGNRFMYVYKLVENNNHMTAVNNIYGGEFQAWFCGGTANSELHTITNNVYGGNFTATHKEALHSEAGRASFYGGDYAATYATTTASAKAKDSSGSAVSLTWGTYYGLNSETEVIPERTVEQSTVYNNIYGGTFEQRIYLAGRIGTTDKVESVISGGIFNGDRLSPGMYQHAASNKATITLDIKPDESEARLFFACRPAASGTAGGAKVSASYGLECLNSRTTDTVTLHAAKKPIYIMSDSFLNFDKVLGEVTFIQTGDWIDDHAYVTVPNTEKLDMIAYINGDPNIGGAAYITTASVAIDSTKKSRVALMGNSGESAPDAITIPVVDGVNFVLDNNLYVNFYTSKDILEEYISKAGLFTYKVTAGADVFASGTIASMDEAEVVDNYVKFRSDLSVAAFDFNTTLTVELAGNTESYTVYELLELGVNVASAELQTLLKAIYNYGVEAETLRYGSSAAVLYDGIVYTGSYNGKASGTSADPSYYFVGTGLTIGKDVSLNFYLKAGSTEGLNVTAASAAGALDASRIEVIPFAGNSQYNVVITLRLDIASMGQVFTVSVKNASGAELATGSTSVAYGCSAYIAQNGAYTPVSNALLTYVEKAMEYKNTLA